MYYVGVDIGGTFTDCVLVDRQGNHRSAKVLSTKDNPVAGVIAGLGQLAETAGVDVPTLLERTDRFGHGTTIGTNAVLERRGARVGLVATAEAAERRPLLEALTAAPRSVGLGTIYWNFPTQEALHRPSSSARGPHRRGKRLE